MVIGKRRKIECIPVEEYVPDVKFKTASKFAKLVINLRLLLKKTVFDKVDPISMLTFLIKICNARDRTSTHNGVIT